VMLDVGTRRVDRRSLSGQRPLFKIEVAKFGGRDLGAMVELGLLRITAFGDETEQPSRFLACGLGRPGLAMRSDLVAALATVQAILQDIGQPAGRGDTDAEAGQFAVAYDSFYTGDL